MVVAMSKTSTACQRRTLEIVHCTIGVKPALEGEKHVHENVGESRSQLKVPQKTMGVKPALKGKKHAHVNVGESRSQLEIPQKTVDLAVQKSHSCL